MNQLTIFYICNYFALLAYIFTNAIFLGRGEVGIFHLLMTINTPFFLVIIIKGITKGLGNLFKFSEFQFRYLAVLLFAFIYVFTAIDAKVLSIYRDHFNIQLFKILFETGVMQDMGVQPSDIITIGIQILLIIIWSVFSLILSIWFYKNKRNLIPQSIQSRIQIGFKTIIVFSIIEKLCFSYLHYTDRDILNHYWNSVPSYTPLRMSKVWTPILNPPSDINS